MRAMIDLDNWSVLYVEDDQGQRWELQGECRPEICKASCCEKGDEFCQHLDPDYQCSLVKVSGAQFNKPLICFVMPYRQEHIDQETQCQLKLVPMNGDRR